MWMVPMTRAVAGIDVSGRRLENRFCGNVNAFYVNAACDDSPNAAVVGGSGLHRRPRDFRAQWLAACRTGIQRDDATGRL